MCFAFMFLFYSCCCMNAFSNEEIRVKVLSLIIVAVLKDLGKERSWGIKFETPWTAKITLTI